MGPVIDAVVMIHLQLILFFVTVEGFTPNLRGGGGFGVGVGWCVCVSVGG